MVTKQLYRGRSFVFLLNSIYFISTVLLAIYGLNSLALCWLYLRHRHEDAPCPPMTDWPAVTVQLPIYNELYVAERLIGAVAGLDYPPDKLQIQVLDDSTDETTAVARACVDRYRAQGLDIELLHRGDRTGFKAGALGQGLTTAKGEFIAIFDADFVPRPGFLRETIPHFREQPHLGVIQTRWEHINADYSLLTRAQSIALDGHFMVEQTARNRAGLFMNFNGTAGVWRRQCIEEAGGWQGDTLSEDLDLSYRAQLRGWKFLFLPHVAAPAEIPPQINAFKRQQFRWAKGSIQCLRKLGPRVLAAPVSFAQRFEGLVHLSTYLLHPLMLVLLLITLPLMFWPERLHLHLAYLSLASLGPPLLYAFSQRALYPNWMGRMVKYFPILMLLGIGVALNNSRAVYEALTGHGNNFRRTPKFRVESRSDQWATKRYVLPLDWTIAGEVLLTAYSLLTTGVALAQRDYGTALFMLLYVGSFGYVAALGLRHSLPRLRTSWSRLARRRQKRDDRRAAQRGRRATT